MLDADTADPGPGLISVTRCVPSAVPSENHGSAPVVASPAKKTTPFATAATVREAVNFDALPEGICLTTCVPASVPSLTHNCVPVAASPPTKKNRPPVTVMLP